MAMEAAGREPMICTLGPIIHNQQVVDRLQQMGIRVVERVEEAQGGAVLIRTHGVPRGVISEAEELGIRVIDTTCPFVGRAHQRVRSLIAEGYAIVIVGERDHPEVVGIMGWAGADAYVVEGPEDAAALPRMPRVGVVAQTTQTLGNVANCIGELLRRSSEIKVHNTLCDATMQRQRAAEELARQVGVMVVTGGHHSGNTRRLAEICRASGTPTHHIEAASDLRPEWFAELPPTGRVGVTAGASTPDWAIDEVLTALGAMLPQPPSPQSE
jgi:4-hydroxy-3-methylbut-2-enyl diphosphate reductase